MRPTDIQWVLFIWICLGIVHERGYYDMDKVQDVEMKQAELLSWIDNQEEFLIQFLQELLYIPAENPPGYTYGIAEFIERKLKEFGFDNTQLLKVSNEDLEAVGLKEAQNILTVQSFGTNGGPEIALSANGDTVPPGIGWTVDPYDAEIINGAIFGRGAAIAKSDIAVYTFALLALKKLSTVEDLSGSVRLAYTFDGESGGTLGPKWLLDHKYMDPDMAITPGFTHSILNAHNGCIQLEVRLSGRATHGSIQSNGVDTLYAMNDILSALYQYREDLQEKQSGIRGLHSPTLTIGQIEGGTSISIIPDQCTIRLDRRFIPEEDGAEVEQRLEQLIREEVSAHTGIECEIERVLYAPTFGPTSEESTLIQALTQNWELMFPGKALKIGGIPLYSDARHFSEMGIPTVMFGAGPASIEEANGYAADEHVQISDLVQATKIVALTLYDLLLEKD